MEGLFYFPSFGYLHYRGTRQVPPKMKVIRAIKKSPMPNDCFITETINVAKFDMPGIAKPKSGIMKSSTSA